jgi:hypothetical protein
MGMITIVTAIINATTIFDIQVRGATSPYPTVDMVTTMK